MMNVIPVLGIVLAIILVLLGGCKTLEPLYPETLVEEISILGSQLTEEWTSDLEPYTKAFPFLERRLYARVLVSENYRLALFRIDEVKENSLGDILIVHGYMAHSGHLLSFGERLSQENWQVYFLDLPSHGLSNGERFSITDFAEYGRAVADSWNTVSRKGRVGLMIGHSTGGSAIFESLPLLQGNLPQGIVLGAPLFELQRRGFRTTLNSLAGDRTIKLPEIFRNPRYMSQGASQNPEFRDFALLGDPLYYWIYAPSWLNAYDRWVQRIFASITSVYEDPVLVLQGEEDSVIDWKKNEELLPKFFPNLVIRSFTNYTHTIFNLVPDELEIVIKQVIEFGRETQKSENR